MTQNQWILYHLENFGSITQKEAMDEYGIMRLASRINDLKRMGHHIGKQTCVGKNRFGDKVHYTKYTLNVSKEK